MDLKEFYLKTISYWTEISKVYLNPEDHPDIELNDEERETLTPFSKS